MFRIAPNQVPIVRGGLMCGNQETATCHLSDWQQKGELIMNMLTASGGESSPWGQHGDLELSRAQREDQAVQAAGYTNLPFL